LKEDHHEFILTSNAPIEIQVPQSIVILYRRKDLYCIINTIRNDIRIITLQQKDNPFSRYLPKKNKSINAIKEIKVHL